MGGTFTCLNYHIIFSSKDRRPAILTEMRDDLYGYIGGIIKGEGGVASSIGGTADHLHLLVRWKSDISISDLVKRIKSHSSGWVNKRNQAKTFYWQEGYGVFTVSESHVPSVVRYIENQEEHHRRRDFTEEFIAFLKRHRISYDESLIWK